MKGRIRVCTALIFCLIVVCMLAGRDWSGPSQSASLNQAGKPSSHEAPFDPLTQITAAFPDSIQIKDKGRLLEFCPDGTCDGFVVQGSMPVSTLKDFGYLYVYFFSDYTFLDEWRARKEAKETAEKVLSKYHKCTNADAREAARCVLRDLSSSGRIRLIFVRYDEGERHVMRRDISKQLAEGNMAPKEH